MWDLHATYGMREWPNAKMKSGQDDWIQKQPFRCGCFCKNFGWCKRRFSFAFIYFTSLQPKFPIDPATMQNLMDVPKIQVRPENSPPKTNAPDWLAASRTSASHRKDSKSKKDCSAIASECKDSSADEKKSHKLLIFRPKPFRLLEARPYLEPRAHCRCVRDELTRSGNTRTK
mgnify:CR=1 FL=1